MDAIERAIRAAFEKGDAEDRDFRDKVYRKAFEALDRGQKANPTMTVETAIGRRKALQATIAAIESEFTPAAPASGEPQVELDFTPDAEPAAAPVPQVGSAADDPLADVVATGIALDDVAPPRPVDPVDPVDPVVPVVDAAPPPAATMRLDPPEARPRRRRRRWGGLITTAVVLALMLAGGWWAVHSGLLKSASDMVAAVTSQTGTEEQGAAGAAGEGPPKLSAQPAEQRDWISVFKAADATQVTAPADAAAEVKQDESGSFLRIRTGKSGEPIVFTVGQGVLQQLAGKSATFDIVTRGSDGKGSQIAVDCDFGALGDCGRKRTDVGYDRGEFLFEVTLPAKRPSGNGRIGINSDFAGQGRSVDVYEIRVSVNP